MKYWVIGWREMGKQVSRASNFVNKEEAVEDAREVAALLALLDQNPLYNQNFL
jgi:hypothetical protein